MFKDCVLKYYDVKNNLSCSETLFYAANEYFNLNLPADALKASSAFGAGMYYGEVCGAISSCAAVVGILYSKGKAHESETMRAMVKELMTEFHNRLKMHYCEPLKQAYKTEEKRCEKMIVVAAEVLEELMEKYPLNN